MNDIFIHENFTMYICINGLKKPNVFLFTFLFHFSTEQYAFEFWPVVAAKILQYMG